jgi:putative effector of murein hydrolase LrgA (UPF0299 family)
MLRALTLVFFCQLAGEWLVAALRLPIPGPVLGMAFLFAGVAWKGEAPAALADVSDRLLSHLSLLFVPAGVGVMALGAALENGLTAISVAILVSTLLGVAATGLTMRALLSVEDEGDAS